MHHLMFAIIQGNYAHMVSQQWKAEESRRPEATGNDLGQCQNPPEGNAGSEFHAPVSSDPAPDVTSHGPAGSAQGISGSEQ